jgi:hypothetical protein
MFRLGRDGEVRGTMTGRDEGGETLVGPLPTRGETGCRTKGDDELRVLGRDDELRALGRDDELDVLGSERPLEEYAPVLVGVLPVRRTRGLVLGSIRLRVEPAEVPPLPLGVRPGR